VESGGFRFTQSALRVHRSSVPTSLLAPLGQALRATLDCIADQTVRSKSVAVNAVEIAFDPLSVLDDIGKAVGWVVPRALSLGLHDHRHCERSEAIQGRVTETCRAALDCFVASLLAMTE
jgi:hypothetical protein